MTTAERAFLDAHTHSRASFDSLVEPRAMVRRALRLGITHLAVTDHERIDGALEVAEEAAHAGGALRIIVGEEVRTREGDLLGLFLREAVPPGLSVAETAAAIRSQGGLVGLPHPFDRLRSSGGLRLGGERRAPSELAAWVDFVEVHNARAYGGANQRAVAFAAEHGLPGVASSDAHSVMELGTATTVLPGMFSTPEELRTLLPAATLLRGRSAYLLRLWTPIAKAVQRGRGNRRRLAGSAATPKGSS